MNRYTLTLLLAYAALPAAAQVQNMTFFKLAGVPPPSTANACYVNDAGIAAASIRYEEAGVTLDHAYQLRNGVTETLPALPGYNRAVVFGINNKGEVLGRLAGGLPNDFAVVVWKNRIPTKIVLPPPSYPANRQLPTPIAIDNAGRILLHILELNPANETVSQKYLLLIGGAATELPPLTPAGAVTTVHSYAYTAMNNSADMAGFALVTRLGQLQVIGFVRKNSSFQEVLVDQMFGVRGLNQKGEVFGDRNDGSFFVWRNGQVEIFPRLMASTLVTTSSFTNAGDTCANVRIFQDASSSTRENAILSFTSKTNP